MVPRLVLLRRVLVRVLVRNLVTGTCDEGLVTMSCAPAFFLHPIQPQTGNNDREGLMRVLWEVLCGLGTAWKSESRPFWDTEFSAGSLGLRLVLCRSLMTTGALVLWRRSCDHQGFHNTHHKTLCLRKVLLRVLCAWWVYCAKSYGSLVDDFFLYNYF